MEMLGKVLVWAILAGFTGYTIYCSRQEGFFKSVKKMLSLHWGRQVGVDLYIGLSLAIVAIGLVEKSVAAAALWAVPIYVLGNIATLLYIAIHYDVLFTLLVR